MDSLVWSHLGHSLDNTLVLQTGVGELSLETIMTRSLSRGQCSLVSQLSLVLGALTGERISLGHSIIQLSSDVLLRIRHVWTNVWQRRNKLKYFSSFKYFSVKIIIFSPVVS